jgi:hypothetical protein
MHKEAAEVQQQFLLLLVVQQQCHTQLSLSAGVDLLCSNAGGPVYPG